MSQLSGMHFTLRRGLRIGDIKSGQIILVILKMKQGDFANMAKRKMVTPSGPKYLQHFFCFFCVRPM